MKEDFDCVDLLLMSNLNGPQMRETSRLFIFYLIKQVCTVWMNKRFDLFRWRTTEKKESNQYLKHFFLVDRCLNNNYLKMKCWLRVLYYYLVMTINISLKNDRVKPHQPHVETVVGYLQSAWQPWSLKKKASSQKDHFFIRGDNTCGSIGSVDYKKR